MYKEKLSLFEHHSYFNPQFERKLKKLKWSPKRDYSEPKFQLQFLASFADPRSTQASAIAQNHEEIDFLIDGSVSRKKLSYVLAQCIAEICMYLIFLVIPGHIASSNFYALRVKR